ncbi:3-deoxy-D-manno-octulosonic-acid transferase [Flavobacteriales bacterium]|nr:3-deoxy-D-manno-octulosonic acid transferase [Flavobacteriales bacterium]MCL4817159.1 3-deoxy-D-manno-octulosonic acid transferase [Flavobacteriales bacterium]WKZ75368.1 MAG: glycosyltransferase N-terminal domain-containing protein [Vicingaceae bacterium]GIK70771.1 MAG: 3-deoxy-D-manno-octulosonic acid transferase [Bacteroidota bacterium]CAG0992246.1 3-deoxy-D-manno-octulosonic-acid transferase [Flavobacteriales bacterium]
MRILYTFAIHLYTQGIYIASSFNTKAKKWIKGRKKWRTELKEKIKDENYFWVHCASLGEFEQGRPLIEKLKKEHPHIPVLLSFFSPSGFEIRKNYVFADVVCYLPSDTPKNVKQFLDLVKPSAAFFIKYEFWFNYLNEIKERNIPCYLVSGVFRPNQHFFKFYGNWFKKHLTGFTFFFLQNEESCLLLKKIGFTNYLKTGDTRFDRCMENAAFAKEIASIKEFKENQFLVVAGSSWPSEEKIIAAYINKQQQGVKCIIAPHEIHEAHLKFIESLFTVPIVRYSKARKENIQNAQVLLIDNIGMLSSLYQYADMAIIGGAFHSRLHNSLEAAVFGIPILFGPNYHKNVEAKDLIERKAAFSFSTLFEFTECMEKFLNESSFTAESGNAAKSYMAENTGATDKILKILFH